MEDDLAHQDLFQACVARLADSLGRPIEGREFETGAILQHAAGLACYTHPEFPLRGVYAIAATDLERDMCLLAVMPEIERLLAGAAALCCFLDPRLEYNIIGPAFCVYMRVESPDEAWEALQTVDRAMGCVSKAVPDALLRPGHQISNKVLARMVAHTTALAVLAGLIPLAPWPAKAVLLLVSGLHICLVLGASAEFRRIRAKCRQCDARDAAEAGAEEAPAP